MGRAAKRAESPQKAAAVPLTASGTGLADALRVVFEKLAPSVVLLVAACGSPVRHEEVEPTASPAAAYAVTIVTPAVLRGLPLDKDSDGRVRTTPCATCHEARHGVPLPSSGEKLGGPHAGLRVLHGQLACSSCHAATQRDRLHLADGRPITITEAIELCSQCHGPQRRDYDHGAHGGMRGYWDLSRGPRERNHCVSCHDPHAPAFGKFMPMPAPKDRFSSSEATHHD